MNDHDQAIRVCELNRLSETEEPKIVFVDMKTDYGTRKIPLSAISVVIGFEDGRKLPFSIYRGCLVDEAFREFIPTAHRFPIHFWQVFRGLPYFMGNLTTLTGYDSRANGHIYAWIDNLVNYYYPKHISEGYPIPCYEYADFNNTTPNMHIQRVILPLRNEHIEFLLSFPSKLVAVGGVNPTPEIMERLKQRNIKFFRFVIHPEIKDDNIVS